MKIGLVYAMTGEIESLLTQENAQPLQTVAGVPFYRIRPDVIACAGGVSKVNAAMATQLLISLYQPDLVLNAGVAGCFEDMPIGSIVLAEGFLQHDVDTSALGDPVGLVSTVNRVQFPTSDLDRAKAAMDRVGVPYRTGWVRHRHPPGPLDRRHLPPAAVRYGGLRRRPGVFAQRGALHVRQVRVRLSVRAPRLCVQFPNRHAGSEPGGHGLCGPAGGVTWKKLPALP